MSAMTSDELLVSEAAESAHGNSAPANGVVFACIGLIALTLVTYWPSLQSEFVHLDDYQYIVDNSQIRQPGWEGIRRFVTEVSKPTTVEGYYQPLTMLSLLLDSWWSGATLDSVSPWPYHFTNLVLHGVTSALVFVFLRQLCGGFAFPLIAGAIFAVHPVQVESVAWISQRKTVLATPLAIGCLMAYVRWYRAKRAGWYALSLLLYILANLAKPTIVLLPLALPLLDFWPLKRRPLRCLIEKWPFLLGMIAFGAIAFVSQSSSGIGVPQLWTWSLLGRMGCLLCYNFTLYLGNLVWPMSLSPYRSLPTSLDLTSPPILGSVLLTISIIVVWLGSFRRSPALFVGLGAFVLTLAPALGVVRFMASCVADRFVYFPFAFLLIPFVACFESMELRRPRFATMLRILPLLFMVPLFLLNRAQQGVWRDSKALWSHVAIEAPDLPKAYFNLAEIYMKERDFDEAIRQARRAQQLAPDDSANLHVLARSMVRRGAAADAVPIIQRAIEIGLGPNERMGYLALAEAFVCTGRYDEAEVARKKAEELGIAPAESYSVLGSASLRLADNCAAAIVSYERAVALDQANPGFHWNLGTSLEYCGRGAEALAQYEATLRILAQRGEPVSPELQVAVDRLRKKLNTQQPAREMSQP